jgi:hypothetical protein
MTGLITWAEYDRLQPAAQEQFAQVRLANGSTGWKHRSNQAVQVLPPERVSAAEWAAMGPAARWQYARSFSAAGS